MIRQTSVELSSPSKSTLRKVSKVSCIYMTYSNSEYLALATVTALLFPAHPIAVDKEINSAVHANQWTEQTISRATECSLSICSICLLAAENKGSKIKRKEKKKKREGKTFHNHVIWTGIIASTSRLIFKYTWVRNNSTPQSSCGHSVYSPSWHKSLFLCEQFLMQKHLNVC